MSDTKDRIAFAARGVALLAAATLNEPTMRAADDKRRAYLEGLLTAFAERMLSENPLMLLRRWHSDDYDGTNVVVGLYASVAAVEEAMAVDMLAHKDAGWKWDFDPYMVQGR